MRRRPPRSTRTDPHCPATTRFGSVVGLGDKAKFAVPQYLKAVADAARALKGGAGASALFTLSELEVAGRDKARNIRQAVIAASHARSEEHTSELQSLMRISYAVFCLKHKNKQNIATT